MTLFSRTGLADEWSRRKDFHAWAGVDSTSAAIKLILRTCNITSLAELNRDPAAGKVFDDEIRLPFVARLKETDG
jgi:hypothetical protein